MDAVPRRQRGGRAGLCIEGVWRACARRAAKWQPPRRAADGSSGKPSSVVERLGARQPAELRRARSLPCHPPETTGTCYCALGLSVPHAWMDRGTRTWCILHRRDAECCLACGTGCAGPASNRGPARLWRRRRTSIAAGNARATASQLVGSASCRYHPRRLSRARSRPPTATAPPGYAEGTPDSGNMSALLLAPCPCRCFPAW